MCRVCSTVFYKKPTCSMAEWETRAKYCSATCYWESKKGKSSWNAGTKGVCKPNSGSFQAGKSSWNKGLKGYRAGPLNNKWKGEDKIGYQQKHIQLTKKFGRPLACEHCEKQGSKQNNRWTIEWAKKQGHEYTVKREDYLWLCRKCHVMYDRWW